MRSIQMKSPWVQFLLALGNPEGTSMVMMAHLESKKLRRFEIADRFIERDLSEIQGLTCFGPTLTL